MFPGNSRTPVDLRPPVPKAPDVPDQGGVEEFYGENNDDQPPPVHSAHSTPPSRPGTPVQTPPPSPRYVPPALHPSTPAVKRERTPSLSHSTSPDSSTSKKQKECAAWPMAHDWKPLPRRITGMHDKLINPLMDEPGHCLPKIPIILKAEPVSQPIVEEPEVEVKMEDEDMRHSF